MPTTFRSGIDFASWLTKREIPAPFTLEDYEAAIDFAETDPYGALEYAVGSGDDFVCFDFHQHENGDFTLHSVVNSETGCSIQDMEHPYRVPEDRAVFEALGLIDQGLLPVGPQQAGGEPHLPSLLMTRTSLASKTT